MGHGKQLDQQVTSIKDEHRRRSATLGLDPELILVLETNGPLDPAAVERAGLVLLEVRSDRALVAFSADPELTEFVARNEKYAEGTRGVTEAGNERGAAYEDLFDRIDLVRTIANADLLGAELSGLLDDDNLSQTLQRLEIHCWCPEDPAEARRRSDDVARAIQALGGQVLSQSVRAVAGWSAICCDLALKDVEAVLMTDRVSWMNTMPRPMLDAPILIETSHDSIPTVALPPPQAPILAVIDSGIRSAHPLLAGAVVGVEFAGDGLGDGGDESGHGTLVSSIALFGSLEDLLASGTALTPAGRLLSIRVLDRENMFWDQAAWPDTLMTAMGIAVAGGARVINLSIGDDRTPYLAARPTAVAALVDQFIRENPDVVVVTCTGNISTSRHSTKRLLSNEYVEDLLNLPDGGLLDPGTAILSLTVGALGAAYAQGVQVRLSAEKVAVGGPNLPSPFTRVGPGPMGATKPEMGAPAGSVMVDSLVGRAVDDASVQVLGAGGVRPDQLLATSSGTSYAAPLLSHAALRVLGRYPELNGNSARALLLVGAEELPGFMSDDSAAARADQRRLVGYGRVSASRSEASNDHRVVLVSESSLLLDQVHFYRIPVPSSFRETGGWREISVALAFDPPVRVTRLDYLANKMGFQVFHGPSLSEVRAAYVRAESEGEIDKDVDESPTELSSYQLKLQPSNQARSRGTNQFGRYRRSVKVGDDKPNEYIIAVRSMNSWDTPGEVQNYSLAIALERDEFHGALYAELRAELPPLTVEVEVEVEAELEIQ